MMLLNHIALLVPSVERSASVLRERGIFTGPAERWDGEGTLEIYAGEDTRSGRLLLMEAVKEGAYSRAMKKRGPGLHHLAVDVVDLEAGIDGLSGSGWLMHPKSLKTIKSSRTAYLARPGMPMLIEIQERERPAPGPALIERLELRLPVPAPAMLEALGISDIVKGTAGKETVFFAGGVRFGLEELLR